MSKRVLVFGGSGMLGRRVWAALEAVGWHVIAVPHRYADITQENQNNVYDKAKPDLVINCAGAIGARHFAPQDMILVNAFAPHIVAYQSMLRSIPVIHISTDCVFSGVPDGRFPGRRYAVTDPTDATDIYGRSKALGEVQAAHVTNVRTSFIGPEHGLWAWLAEEAQKSAAHAVRIVPGWANAFWTGSTAEAVAAAIVELAEHPPGGTVHLATEEKISKLDVLRMLKDRLGLDVEIRPEQEPRIDRALEPTIVLPSLQEALLGLGVDRPVRS